MFDTDRWVELAETLRTSKLRTAATALAVAWGIFMLVILLGAGRGIRNGVENNFDDDAINSIWVYSGRTSKPFAGYGVGRSIRFRISDYDQILENIDRVEHSTARFYLSGQFTVRYGREVSSFEVRACHPGHRYIENTIITEGRFINEIDLRDRRKVAVIGPAVVERLFEHTPPVGEYIEISGTPYRVVGTFNDTGWESELSKIYVPITTAQTAYGGGDTVHQIMFTVGDASAEESRAITEDVRRLLARRHGFAVDDKRAVGLRNSVERAETLENLFAGIDLFIWIVGIGTILAGIVGVSNIMLISVRERTREIGLRKALGATPRTIVSQIIMEALVITSVSGYLGLMAGLGLLEAAKVYVPKSDFFQNPEADLGVVVSATLLLIVSGVLAGYFPARLAAQVNPVEALRAE
ncbi:MAG: ABC transporter permease [Polyangiaceae bacterium]